MTQEQKVYHAKRDIAAYWQGLGGSVLLCGLDEKRFNVIVDLPATVSHTKARELVDGSGGRAQWRQVRGSRLDICYHVI